MNRTTASVVVILVGISCVLSGCLAAAAGGAAAGAGGYAWATGKLSFTTSHSINECHNATISALQDLGITVLSDRTDNLSGRIKGETATGDPVAVDLEPQAQGITKVDVRVGFWGNHTHSVRIADAIKRHLR